MGRSNWKRSKVNKSLFNFYRVEEKIKKELENAKEVKERVKNIKQHTEDLNEKYLQKQKLYNACV